MRRRTLLLAGVGLAVPVWASPGSSFHPFDVLGSRVRLTIGPGQLAMSRESVAKWLADCCQAVAAWYGRFPVHPLRVELTVGPGAGIGGGVTYGSDEALILANIGRDSSLADLEGGWVMIHELVHLACPRVPRASHWLEEGLSTYVEPWVRVKCGQLQVVDAWRDLVDGIPKGLPKAGDMGLDHTPTWGRTYWGGALFAMLLDMRLLADSGNQRGLGQVLRGVVSQGGSIRQAMTTDQLMTRWDQIAHSAAPSQLYTLHRGAAIPTDLQAIWRQLGVHLGPSGLTLDPSAPLAATRQAMEG